MIQLVDFGGGVITLSTVHVESVGGLFGRPDLGAGWLGRVAHFGGDVVPAPPALGKTVQFEFSITRDTLDDVLTDLDGFGFYWSHHRFDLPDVPDVVSLRLDAVPGWEWRGVCGQYRVDASLLGVGHARILAEFVLADARRFGVSGGLSVNVTAPFSTGGSVGLLTGSVVNVGQWGAPLTIILSMSGLRRVEISTADRQGMLVLADPGGVGMPSGPVVVDSRFRRVWEAPGGVDVSWLVRPGSSWPEFGSGSDVLTIRSFSTSGVGSQTVQVGAPVVSL